MSCPKCGVLSGGDWSQCEGSCPMPGSPHFDRDAFVGATIEAAESPLRSCRDCTHCGEVEQHTKIVCRWEKSFLPPPVFRARLWGKNPPDTWPEAAQSCPQYEVKP